MLLWMLGCMHLFQLAVFFFFSPRWITRTGITRSYDGFMTNFLRKLHAFLLSGCHDVHPHQQCTKFPSSPRAHQQLFLVVFMMIAILADLKWSLIVVLIFISLMISNIEHLLMCICWPYTCLWRNIYLDRMPFFKQDSLIFRYWVILKLIT